MISKKNIQFDFDLVNRILYKTQYGEVSISEISDAWDWAFGNKIIPDGTRKYLLDYREAIILETAKSSEFIISYYNDNLDKFYGSKLAIVSNSPKNIALSMLIAKENNSFSIKPFTSIEMALEWLNQ